MKYWEWEKKSSRFMGNQIRIHALTGEGKPHKETLIEYGPWCTGTGNEIMRALLKEKDRKALADFNSIKIQRIFGRPKSEVIETLLSGIVGTEFYMIAMVLIACKLRRNYGELVEVQCVDSPIRIILIYESGHRITIGEHSGHPDITMMKFGYHGTGPDCFYAFLNESGFDVSLEEIAKIKPPYTLRKKEKV